jgi:hypothetical protein
MNRFRCQYQKGKLCVSDSIEDENPITSTQILSSLARLAIKVKDEVNWKTGCKVALKVLMIHEFVMKNIHGNNILGNGQINTYLLGKTNKKKMERSERIDLECYGSFGASDNSSKLNKYILMYREYKKWN